MAFDSDNSGGNGWVNDWAGRGSYAPGSKDEFDNFYLADDERISDEGIAAGGWDMDYMGTLLGRQGAGTPRQRAPMAQAPAVRAPNAMNTLQGLMGMVGKPQQMQRPGQPYQNQYVTSLMNV